MSQWPYRPENEEPDDRPRHTYVQRVDYKPTYLAHRRRIVSVILPQKEEDE